MKGLNLFYVLFGWRWATFWSIFGIESSFPRIVNTKYSQEKIQETNHFLCNQTHVAGLFHFVGLVLLGLFSSQVHPLARFCCWVFYRACSGLFVLGFIAPLVYYFGLLSSSLGSLQPVSLPPLLVPFLLLMGKKYVACHYSESGPLKLQAVRQADGVRRSML